MITAYVGAGALAVGLAGGYYFRDLQADSQALKEQKASVVLTEKQQIHVGESAEIVVKKEIEYRTKYVTIREKAKELDKTPFYAPGNLCLDDDGLRLLAETRAVTEAGSKPEGPVREVASPEKR